MSEAKSYRQTSLDTVSNGCLVDPSALSLLQKLNEHYPDYPASSFNGFKPSNLILMQVPGAPISTPAKGLLNVVPGASELFGKRLKHVEHVETQTNWAGKHWKT